MDDSTSILIWTLFLVTLNLSGGSSDKIGVYMTMENTINVKDPKFPYCTFTEMDETDNTNMFDVMNYTAKINNDFYFESKYFDVLGEYISSIRGLDEDISMNLSWSFGRRTKDSPHDCIFPVGVSSYHPINMEHIVFKYRNWNHNDPLPTCTIANETITLNFDSNKDDVCPGSKDDDNNSATRVGVFYGIQILLCILVGMWTEF